MFRLILTNPSLRLIPLAVRTGSSDRSLASFNSVRAAMDLSGILPPIPTNFRPDGSIDYEATKSNVEHFLKIPFRGLVVFGSNGEACLVSGEEQGRHVAKLRTLMTTAATAQSKPLLIAGVKAEGTAEAVDQCKRLSESGADAVLVATPSFYKSSLTHAALVAFYTEVADNSPCPVILYNVPSNTGVDMAAETAIELSTHRNVIGMKDSGGDVAKLSLIVHRTREKGFQVLAGSAGFLLPALSVGCVGGVCALANILGEEVVQLHRLTAQHRYEEAAQLQGRVVEPNAMVTRRFGVPGLKAAMDMFGLAGGSCRGPLLPITPAERELIRQAFVRNGFQPTTPN